MWEWARRGKLQRLVVPQDLLLEPAVASPGGESRATYAAEVLATLGARLCSLCSCRRTQFGVAVVLLTKAF